MMTWLPRGCLVVGGGECVEMVTSDEVYALFQSIDIPIAVVLDPGSDSNSRNQSDAIDVVDRVQHGFGRLDPTLGHDLAADEFVVSLVYHHQTTEDDVTLDHNHLFAVGPRHVPLGCPEDLLPFRVTVQGSRMDLRRRGRLQQQAFDHRLLCDGKRRSWPPR